MIEFYEDLIENDPSQAYPPDKVADGTYIQRTGDAVVDKWQKDVAEGKQPDFFADMPPGERERIEKMLGRKIKTLDDLNVSTEVPRG